MLKGRTVLLGVCGGIAAYKAASLCSKLVQAGATVKVIMTKSAAQFITPLTFQTISRHQVMIDTFEERDASVVSHIDLADSADIVVIAPATANMIAKMANGLADDMLSTTLLATTAPILVAPAMNVHMYAHPAVQQNIATLLERGVDFFDPAEGQLACGYAGKGRLAEPEQIFARIAAMLSGYRPLEGKKLLVTAGGTVERIDPVRYISNDSSGKMGYAIAEAARDLGADVTLISANKTVSPPHGVRIVPVISAQDMFDAVMDVFKEMDVIVKAAAVADYRPASVSDIKIKKQEDTLTLKLEKTPDILKTLGERKTTQFLVGFAAETNDVERYALDKLRRKNCDLIIANDVTQEGAGFGKDTNKVHIFDANGLVQALPILSKAAVAGEILRIVAERMRASRGNE